MLAMTFATALPNHSQCFEPFLPLCGDWNPGETQPAPAPPMAPGGRCVPGLLWAQLCGPWSIFRTYLLSSGSAATFWIPHSLPATASVPAAASTDLYCLLLRPEVPSLDPGSQTEGAYIAFSSAFVSGLAGSVLLCPLPSPEHESQERTNKLPHLQV